MSTQMKATRQKRNRGLLSCTECHRRKQKCDRSLPCRDCKERGLATKCKYLAPIHNPVSDTGKPRKDTISRLRRIVTGEEFILSSESVDSLAKIPEYDPIKDHEFTQEIAELVQSGLDQRLPMYQYKPPPSPTVSSGLIYGNRYGTLGGLDPFSILPETAAEPVPKQLLVRYYIERLAPWLTYLDDDHHSDKPRLAWLPFALRHSAFFHATLLTAAVHLNRRRPLRNPSAMIWFKLETIRLANEKMNIPEEAATDEMIMVAMILLYFNVGGGNIEEYQIHLNGIHQMLKIRGGSSHTGMQGMVRNWTSVCYGPWREDWDDDSFV